MNSTMYALNTAGSAAGARVRAHQAYGNGWQTVTALNGATCHDPAFQATSSNQSAFMAITGTKRPPRRLGQRTT